MAGGRTALILGVTGQDGAYLAKQLLDDGWTVFGGFRRGASSKIWRLNFLGVTKRIALVECQINDLQNVIDVMQRTKPDRVYHLAGESFVADSFKYPRVTLESNALGVLNILEAMRMVAPDARLVCASSSEIFSGCREATVVNENSSFHPTNPYGISKVAALHLVRLFRESHGLYACSAIFFNHESPLRGREYVVRKIAYNMARLAVQGGEPFNLGNLDASRDWGSADDYMRAMRAMLELPQAEDLVVATGALTKVRDILRIAADVVGFVPVFENAGVDEICRDEKSGRIIARVAQKYFRPHDTPALAGDASRLIELTGWRQSQSIQSIISDMVAADIERWKNGITNV